MENAEKLLEEMRRTKDGWKPKDFERLFVGFGFKKKEGGNHTTYFYKQYGMIFQVARHNSLATGYAADAVKLIDRLKELKRQ